MGEIGHVAAAWRVHDALLGKVVYLQFYQGDGMAHVAYGPEADRRAVSFVGEVTEAELNEALATLATMC